MYIYYFYIFIVIFAAPVKGAFYAVSFLSLKFVFFAYMYLAALYLNYFCYFF